MVALTEQVEEVRRRYPGANLAPTADGFNLLVVCGVPLPAGWNSASTTVTIMVPAGYPTVKLDCFYADASLALAGGGTPKNSGLNTLAGRQYRWFSWHTSTWDPNTDTLDKYLRFCESRLVNVQP